MNERRVIDSNVCTLKEIINRHHAGERTMVGRSIRTYVLTVMLDPRSFR